VKICSAGIAKAPKKAQHVASLTDVLSYALVAKSNIKVPNQHRRPGPTQDLENENFKDHKPEEA